MCQKSLNGLTDYKKTAFYKKLYDKKEQMKPGKGEPIVLFGCSPCYKLSYIKKHIFNKKMLSGADKNLKC